MTFIGPMSDITDSVHALLEPPSPAYTNVTVRRAFIVWMYCGQRNKFKDVCNYFHYLEALEEKLSPECRALSRHYEFDLFSNQPPTSTYLIDHFPHLYKESSIERHYVSKVEAIRHEKCVFKLEGFNEITPKNGTTTQEIVEVSRMIRKYCRIQMISLKKFLEEFKQHAGKCGLKYTVTNIAFYIKRKMVQAEIELEENYPKTLGFLNSTYSENIFDDIQGNTTTSNSTVNDANVNTDFKEADKADKEFKRVKILQKNNLTDLELTKNYRDNCNIIGNNASTSPKTDLKDIGNDFDLMFLNNDTMTPKKAKAISIEDLASVDNPLKKERRFSGSRFMKFELEKFRKI